MPLCIHTGERKIKKKASSYKEICEYLLEAALHGAATGIDHRSYTGKTGAVPASTQGEMESICESMHVCTSPSACQRNHKQISRTHNIIRPGFNLHLWPKPSSPRATVLGLLSNLAAPRCEHLWATVWELTRRSWDPSGCKTPQPQWERFLLRTTDHVRTKILW